MESILANTIAHIARELPWARTVDEDYGQLEALDNEQLDMYPLTFPAILIDLPGTEWTDTGDIAQRGTCEVRVRLILDCYDDTHAGSQTTDRIMQREEKRKALHALLQGYRPSGEGALVRTRSRFFTFNHGIKVYEETYTCALSEATRETRTIARTTLSVRLKT
ncbi:MAG: hypothetical protein HXO19_08380 [Prevotella shahii]|jgi:hypothetical protein|uniref:hypothetical protein n=1 Tax=Hoylesella shahii TaxID=228603 RepID=UPI001CB0F860|nr:hypothetical protein [Hoylesella shahii]MBF1591098.1 hypothetical protein [Hoylesella shahii]DAU84493.1 MAG TPA: hypothetical protein [Caudoviricetes sp.]